MKKHRCTLIVGITSGIGAALAVHLETLGLNIVGTSRNKNPSVNGEHMIFNLDLSSEPQ